MANISNKEIISILETANRWMTFDELSDSIIREHSYTTLSLRLQELAEQGKIQYVPASGMERSRYGKIGLVKDW